MLADFASRFGREFYELPPNLGRVSIEECDLWALPEQYKFGDDDVAPFEFGKPLRFKARRMTSQETQSTPGLQAFQVGMT
jgi:dihydroorotase